MALNRDPANLKPRLQVAWQILRAVMWLLGHPVFIVEGFRPQERQNALHARGITPATHSRHTDCEAIDVAFESADPYDPKHPWELLGMVAEELGLVWGGRWESRDATHIQLP